MRAPLALQRLLNHVHYTFLDQRENSDYLILKNNNRVLIIAFGGIKQGLGMDVPPFEFMRSLHDKCCDIVFLRDREQAYYHLGIKGLGKSVEEIATFLRAIIEEGKYDLVVTLGNSMGGYAAILFASLIQADISIAISARSFLDLENRIAHNDNRRDAEIRRLYKISKGTNSEYLDLRRYLSSKPKEACKKPLYLLFFGDSDELDRIHSTRMGSLESFYVFKINEAGHNAAQKLRNRGGIDRIISSVMQFCEHRDERILLNSVSRDQLCDIVIQDRRMETENFRKSTTK